jgi:hypothetical protein
MPSVSEIPYTAFLQYSPRGSTKASKNSKVFMGAIKNDTHIDFLKDGKPVSVRGIEWIVSNLKREMEAFPFLSECLGPNFTLVPVPRSAPLSNKDALWPTHRICEALVAAGLGAEVAPLLIRRTAVPKSSTSEGPLRPSAELHYSSVEIDNEVPMLIDRPITLVDDIVTKGASLMGMFRRLKEAYPQRDISCFALMHTASKEAQEIETTKKPVRGSITLYTSGKVWRDSGTSSPQISFGF